MKSIMKYKKLLFYYIYILKFFLLLIFIIIIHYLKQYRFTNKNLEIKNNEIIKKIKNLKVCLCTIGKKENLYAKEFIKHYKKLGYNNIFIYDNNDIEGENFENVLKDEIKEGYVIIINYRGYRGKENHPQFDAYKDCYKKNYRKYDWLSFFDFDEFLEIIPSNITIQEFLGNQKYNNCQNIKINWLWYMNNNSLYYENKPVQERITQPNYENIVNKHIKSTIRGNLKKNYWDNMNNPHSSNNNFISCSSSGKIIESASPFNSPPDYKYAFLKHYEYKSFEEFCIKINKGRSDTDYKLYREKMIQYLYERNKSNKEKINIMKKIFNISFE